MPTLSQMQIASLNQVKSAVTKAQSAIRSCAKERARHGVNTAKANKLKQAGYAALHNAASIAYNNINGASDWFDNEDL